MKANLGLKHKDLEQRWLYKDEEGIKRLQEKAKSWKSAF